MVPASRGGLMESIMVRAPVTVIAVVASGTQRRKRQRGSIEQLPSGALRVSVYAGIDPVTGRRHYLREIIRPGAAAAEAEKVMRRLAGQVDERRHPRTSATVDQMLDRYLETLDVGRTTHRMYTRYLEKHVRPFVGRLKAGAVDPEVLDSLYAELRRCRVHCTDRRGTDHRTPREHVCDERCRPHDCKPLSSTTIRHIHFVLRGVYEKGVRWRWVSTNPVTLASPPAARKPDPRPPTPDEAARIVEAAWEDPDWGTLVWLTMTTGARRGELCGLRWRTSTCLAACSHSAARLPKTGGTGRRRTPRRTSSDASRSTPRRSRR
jgi:integrase